MLQGLQGLQRPVCEPVCENVGLQNTKLALRTKAPSAVSCAANQGHNA